MQIKFFRGTHQIGGTVTEISTAKARIIVDFGEELPSTQQKEVTALDIDGVTSGKPACDAVLLTHYHGDHAGAFQGILPEVPIYMGKVAKKIFAVVAQTLKKKLNKSNPERVASFKLSCALIDHLPVCFKCPS